MDSVLPVLMELIMMLLKDFVSPAHQILSSAKKLENATVLPIFPTTMELDV